MKRILILTVPAGGGHVATANAMAEAIRRAYPNDYHVQVTDVMGDLPYPGNIKWDKFVAGTYSGMIKTLNSRPYRLYYKFSSVNAGLINRFAKTVFEDIGRKFLKEYDPDIIISTFPIISYSVSRIVSRNWHKRVPLVSIVTDAGDVHRLWLLGGDDMILVATPDTIEYATQRGVPRERLAYLGFPTDPRFHNLPSPEQARRELGLDPDKITIMVSAGGLGLNTRMVKLAQALSRLELGFQYVFIAGKNAKMLKELQFINFIDDYRAIGFTDEMPKYLAASDAVVGKAGWISLSEAMVTRRPTFISSVVPGQEEPNAEFIESHGLGKVLTETDDIVAELIAIAARPARLKEYQKAFDAFHYDADAGKRIATYIHENFGSDKQLPPLRQPSEITEDEPLEGDGPSPDGPDDVAETA